MKNISGIILVAFLTSLVSAEPPSERDLKDRKELYERMSMNVFSLYHNALHSELPKEDKENWAREGASFAFYYWATTRKGGIPKSEKVERGIAFFYESAVELNMISAFSDPLGRKSLNEKELKNVKVNVIGFRMSQNEYVESVNEFKDFMDNISALRKNPRAMSEGKK